MTAFIQISTPPVVFVIIVIIIDSGRRLLVFVVIEWLTRSHHGTGRRRRKLGNRLPASLEDFKWKAERPNDSYKSRARSN